MVSSMHNEADAQDYIVWHRIWICIDYLLFDLAAGVCVRMCTVHHLGIPGPPHSRIFFQYGFIVFPRVEQTSYSVFGWRGLTTRQACQLFRSVRDMRRRRLAQLPIHDLDITMKTDKSFLLPPAQSLRGCLNSRPGSHHPFKTNVFYRGFSFSDILFSILRQLMMSYPSRIKQMLAMHRRPLREAYDSGCTVYTSQVFLINFHTAKLPSKASHNRSVVKITVYQKVSIFTLFVTNKLLIPC